MEGLKKDFFKNRLFQSLAIKNVYEFYYFNIFRS